MKIVVLDGYTFGQLTVYDRTSESEVLSRIGNAEHVLVNKVPISREIIYKAQNLK